MTDHRTAYSWFRAASAGEFTDPDTLPAGDGRRLARMLHERATRAVAHLEDASLTADQRGEVERIPLAVRRCCAAACASWEESPATFATAMRFAWRTMMVEQTGTWALLAFTEPARRTGAKVRTKGKNTKGPSAEQLSRDVEEMHRNRPRLPMTSVWQAVGKRWGIGRDTVRRKTVGIRW